MFSIKRTDALG